MTGWLSPLVVILASWLPVWCTCIVGMTTFVDRHCSQHVYAWLAVPGACQHAVPQKKTQALFGAYTAIELLSVVTSLHVPLRCLTHPYVHQRAPSVHREDVLQESAVLASEGGQRLE